MYIVHLPNNKYITMYPILEYNPSCILTLRLVSKDFKELIDEDCYRLISSIYCGYRLRSSIRDECWTRLGTIINHSNTYVIDGKIELCIKSRFRRKLFLPILDTNTLTVTNIGNVLYVITSQYIKTINITKPYYIFVLDKYKHVKAERYINMEHCINLVEYIFN